MDFLTFMDEFFKRDWKNPFMHFSEVVRIEYNQIILQIQDHTYQIEIEKIESDSDSFRLDIPHQKETMDDFERFYGTYDYVKSIIDDLITMEDNIYKLAYGRSKPKLIFSDIDCSKIYKELMGREEK